VCTQGETLSENYNRFSKSAILSAVAQSKESMMKTAGGMDIPPAVFWYLTILFVKTLCILSFDML
jgi:hypothetical protein